MRAACVPRALDRTTGVGYAARVEAITAALDTLARPLIEADGGTLEVLSLEDDTLHVRLGGSYGGCPGVPEGLPRHPRTHCLASGGQGHPCQGIPQSRSEEPWSLHPRDPGRS